jgi:hypothetical protein
VRVALERRVHLDADRGAEETSSTGPAAAHLLLSCLGVQGVTIKVFTSFKALWNFVSCFT